MTTNVAVVLSLWYNCAMENNSLDNKEIVMSVQENKESTNLIVDFDASPLAYRNLKVVEHKKAGKWRFEPSQLELHFCKSQQEVGYCNPASRVYSELATEPVVNANLLDFYLLHKDLIPQEWKNQSIYFWGTIYSHQDGSGRYVRFLMWVESSGGWISSEDDFTGDSLTSNCPAIVFAGNKQ